MNQMTYKPLSIEELRDLINKGSVSDPIVFLESIMNGHDPRKLSRVYELVCEIDSFNDSGDIPRSDWNELVDLVLSEYKYQSVSLNESTSAARTVAEYLHPKRKQIETKGGSNGSSSPSDNPLTEEEIEVFKEKFNDDF